MMQGILFDDIHSYRDLNLILSKEDRPPAKPKTNYIDIPGSDIPIDLTEANGEVRYNSRNFTFTFSFMGQDDFAWEAKRTEVGNLLNGKACKITLDKDPEFYWLGRCTVSKILSDRRKKQIVVTAKVHPYKYRQRETTQTYDLTTEERTVILSNSRKTVCPVITCTNDNTVIGFNGNTFNFSAGKHKNLNIRFTEGNNEVTISGSGQVTFAYQEGEL